MITNSLEAADMNIAYIKWLNDLFQFILILLYFIVLYVI